MSPLGKHVHKVYSSECIERCKYGLICFVFFFLWNSVNENGFASHTMFLRE